MPNKKYILIPISIVLVSLAANLVVGQSLYVKAGGGYSLPLGGTDIYSYMQRDAISPNIPELANLSDNPERVERLRTSYGKGGKFFMAVGYMFNNFLGLEVAGGRFLGTIIRPEYNFSGKNGFPTMKTRATMYTISSSLVVSTGRDAGLNAYARAGVLFGIDPRVYTDGQFTLFNNDVVQSSDELSEGTPFGIVIDFGVSYPVGERLSLFGEIEFSSISHKFGRRKFKQFVLNGVNILPSLDNTDFILLDRVTDDHGPAVDQTHTMPFSSIGLNVGISYNILGKKVLPRSR